MITANELTLEEQIKIMSDCGLDNIRVIECKNEWYIQTFKHPDNKLMHKREWDFAYLYNGGTKPDAIVYDNPISALEYAARWIIQKRIIEEENSKNDSNNFANVFGNSAGNWR